MAEIDLLSPTLRLHPADPLVLALSDLKPGDSIENGKVRVQEPVGKGHKVAVQPIAAGEPVRKFGQIIGNATKAIQPGQHVHVHNLAFRPSAADHTIGADRRNTAPLPEAQAATFQGIVRADGSVATRNYIGVLTTVNCSATVARLIADQFRGPQALADFPNVDGVVALTHKSGCAAAAEGEADRPAAPHDRRLCQASEFRRRADHRSRLRGQPAEPAVRMPQGIKVGDRVHTYVIQETGGTNATVRAGVRAHQADAARGQRR